MAGFTVTEGPPTIASVSPNHGAQGQTLNVSISGTKLTEATAVSFGPGITVNSFTINRSTRITANITIDPTAGLGPGNVSVTATGGTGTLTGGFTVIQGPPSISSVSPNHGAQGQTLTVTISGTRFTGATAVSFGSRINVNSFTVDSDNQITANISIASNAGLGPRNVSVTTPGGTSTLMAGFTVT